jgi:hypothetical protein
MPALEYSTGQIAGIQYTGTFGSGAADGKLVVCTFPFETLAAEQTRTDFINQIVDYWFPASSIQPDPNNLIPADYALQPNYPNPFNPQTTISYQLPLTSRVEIDIYNTLGQRVRSLVARQVAAGTHQVSWDGCNDTGQQLSSGIYIATFSARAVNSDKQYQQSQKLLLTK